MRRPELSVVVCTHDPDLGRLGRVLDALSRQSLARERWEVVLVDNATSPALEGRISSGGTPSNLRVVREDELGLTAARLAGIETSRGDVLVFVDDDNLLAPDYLEEALRLMTSEPSVGAAGGVIEPEFERPPGVYASSYVNLLGVRDFGPRPMRALVYDVVGPWEPVGAGMVIRAAVARRYAVSVKGRLRRTLDRRGKALGSCGDTDMARCAPEMGLYLAYEPKLRMRHVIPQSRVRYGYLLRLCYSLKRSGILLDRIRTGRPKPLRSASAKWARLPLAVVRAARTNPFRWGLEVATLLGEYDARLVPLREDERPR
ncbi:MAG TPA: glycosyltransferase [Thermoanaerobaculia bacterium]|nr:glycosyltransferase [Thermoanaerobaculia bacterium]